MSAYTLLCPVCQQEVPCVKIGGSYVMHAHFREGSAPPCPGSSRTRTEALRAAAAEQRGQPAPSLFD